MEVKKYPKADINRYRAIFFNIGLIVSLSLTYTAFEWKSYDDGQMDTSIIMSDQFEDAYEIPPTEQPPPPPPPPEIKNVNIVEIENTEELEDELDVSFDIEMTEQLVIEDLPDKIEEIEEETSEEIFLIVEEQPQPKGGMKEFYSYVNSSIKYPPFARRLSIQGRVFVQFVIEKDGSIAQVTVLRGIGEGCDAEAIRVISNAARWNPGKQRGRPVRVKMVLPISFKLAD